MIGTIALACLGLSVNTTVEQRRSLDAHAISATAKALGLASKAKGAIGLIKVAKSVGEARALVKQRQGVTAGLVKFDTAGHPVAHMEPVGCGLFDVWGAMFTCASPERLEAMTLLLCPAESPIADAQGGTRSRGSKASSFRSCGSSCMPLAS